MSISQELPKALKLARTRREIPQNGMPGGYTQQMYSMVENGHRELGEDMASPIAMELDDPQLTAAIQRKFTGGVGAAWIDGEYADTSLAAVAMKTIEELEEGIAAIKRIPFSRRPESLDEGERKRVYAEMMQIRDAEVALYNLIGHLCQELEFSHRRLCQDHDQKLISKRYMTQKDPRANESLKTKHI